QVAEMIARKLLERKTLAARNAHARQSTFLIVRICSGRREISGAVNDVVAPSDATEVDVEVVRLAKYVRMSGGWSTRLVERVNMNRRSRLAIDRCGDDPSAGTTTIQVIV